MSIKKTISLLSSSQKGTANGVAELSTAGTVPASQLPSYVDDVIEGTINSDETVFTDMDNRVITPETGKIYVDNTTNKTYRWSGTKYIVIASDLALGETNSTAYAGNKGKALADKIGDNNITSIGDGTVTGAIESLNSNKLDKTGDSKDNTATFTSSDVTDGSSTAWTTVPALTSGEKHSSIFSKMSQMFKNIRYLYKMLGTTDISAIGDGTATGAISSLNSNLGNVSDIINGSLGGTNYILNSSEKIITSSKYVKRYFMSQDLILGEYYTVSLCVTPSEAITYSIDVYDGIYNTNNHSKTYTDGTTNKQIIKMSFRCDRTYDSIIIINWSYDHELTVHYAKLEKGRTMSDWSPSPTDIENTISEMNSLIEALDDRITTLENN